MTSNTYRLQAADKVAPFGPHWPALLRDQSDDKIDRVQVDKLINSGDCFISLATALAETTQQLADRPEKAGPELEKIILTLLYLQDNYQIYHKPTPHP